MFNTCSLKMFSVTLLFTVLVLGSVTCAEEGTTTSEPENVESLVWSGCVSKCGCDGLYVYDAVGDRCLVNFRKVMKSVEVIYDSNDNSGFGKHGMAKSIYLEGERIFKGIMISVFLFMACAGVCIISACIYCCRINYTDWTLKNDVKALAKKLKTNYNSKKMTPKRVPLPEKAESCNVVVEDAGILVV